MNKGIFSRKTVQVIAGRFGLKLNGVQGVPSSNLGAPTNKNNSWATQPIGATGVHRGVHRGTRKRVTESLLILASRRTFTADVRTPKRSRPQNFGLRIESSVGGLESLRHVGCLGPALRRICQFHHQPMRWGGSITVMAAATVIATGTARRG